MVRYQAILEGLATKIEGLDTTTYEGSTSDAWHRMRGVGPIDQDWEHLGFKVSLGVASLDNRPNCITHAGCLVEYMHRTSPDDLFLSQGRILDSALDITNLLTTFGGTSGAFRTVPEGFQIFEADGEYVRVSVPFHMHVTDWRY